MFHYEVMSEKEAIEERFNLLKDGEYDAVIVSSQDKTSGSGNPMMDVTLQVFDAQGRAREVRDFLVFTKCMMWKVIHFANSAGLLKEYEEGKLCSEIVIGKRVRVKIAIESGNEIPADKLRGKPAGSKYSDKNKIEDYINQGVSKGAVTELDPFADDDIPFM